MRIAETVRALRIERGMSVPDCSDRADISRGQWYDVEAGRRVRYGPTLDIICRVAVALGVKPSELFVRAEKENEL